MIVARLAIPPPRLQQHYCHYNQERKEITTSTVGAITLKEMLKDAWVAEEWNGRQYTAVEMLFSETYSIWRQNTRSDYADTLCFSYILTIQHGGVEWKRGGLMSSVSVSLSHFSGNTPVQPLLDASATFSLLRCSLLYVLLMEYSLNECVLACIP
jgi:hypothetical protein